MNTIIYCYDAYCGWCYAFSKVMQQLSADHPGLHMEVFSGGMILPEKPVPISSTADFILQAYPTVEAHSGVKFGADYLWHIKNPHLSDWYPHSEKPAIALYVFKELYPEKQVAFAADLQYALYWEGRDLTDEEAYRHLLEKYSIQSEMFYARLRDDAYKKMAYEEFENCRRLKVTGFPCVFVQHNEVSYTQIARGYTDYATLQDRLQKVLQEKNQA
ncbi:MAG: DsbA family protein [Sediminibacterium sp.]|nr:DsbA family protein [Sediminibacterium sp.]